MYPKIDKGVEILINHVTPEERNAIVTLLQASRSDPVLTLVLAMFRDIYMFRQMTQAMILSYVSKVEELERRITDLEGQEKE